MNGASRTRLWVTGSSEDPWSGLGTCLAKTAMITPGDRLRSPGVIIAVFAKQVPNPDQGSSLDPVTHNLVREAPFILDDADTYSVEMGLQLVDQAGEGEVVL